MWGYCMSTAYHWTEKMFSVGAKKGVFDMLIKGRVAVTIEVNLLAFPRRGGGGSDHAKIFL